MQNNIDKLNPFDEETEELNVIIDTPKDSRNKYKYDEKLGLFKLSGVLAVGHSFPYDFGFIPQTLGGGGDALDVLVLMDRRLSAVLFPRGLSELSKPNKPNATVKPSATID
ncbi:hypothetical protein BH18ACI1_BH18ACI1_05330 [soil metagenome]